jgi:hypothetical protein
VPSLVAFSLYLVKLRWLISCNNHGRKEKKKASTKKRNVYLNTKDKMLKLKGKLELELELELGLEVLKVDYELKFMNAVSFASSLNDKYSYFVRNTNIMQILCKFCAIRGASSLSGQPKHHAITRYNTT